MEFMLMLYSDESGWADLSQAQKKEAMGAYAAYSEALRKAGAFKAASHLQSARLATTVQIVNGAPLVQDGPFVDSKEQIGGYFIIDVPDLDAAIAWAARHPAASHGVVELRAIGVPPKP